MAEDVLFRRIAGAVVVSLFAISIYYRHRADKVGGRVTRDDEPTPIRVGLGVSGLMGFGGLLLYFFWPPALDVDVAADSRRLRWAGATVATVSVLTHLVGLPHARTERHAHVEDPRQRDAGDHRALPLRAPPVLRQRRAGVRRACRW